VVVVVTEPVRLGVDVGGTFTDVVLVTGEQFVTAKTPTTGDQSEGVLDGIETACAEAGIDLSAIDEFAHAMTVSVNVLLERDGARTLLCTTEGFRDVLEIGRQNRPDLYDLFVERPEPLVPRTRRLGVTERATVEGIETEVTEDERGDLVATVDEHDPDAIAVCFLHAYRTPDNEQHVAARLRERFDVPVSVSHEVLSTFREYERTATTVANAYVTPAIDSYLSRLVEQATDRGLPTPHIMQSSGGVGTPDAVRDRAITTALSGPAAGVVGAGALAGQDDTLDGFVSFDMGGTSTDVSLLRDGQAQTTTEGSIAGQPISVPMVDVETVGSGGGSIARVDEGGALRVGPESTGANPGPACYGRGGSEPTVTDAQVVLGYLGPETTLGNSIEIDAEAAHDVLAALAAAAGLASAREAARGVFRVANATMSRAIRSVTVERGTDPRALGLVAFGGAGPVHAAAVADQLSIDTVVVPLAGGVLSAYGLLAADETHDVAVTRRRTLGAVDVESIETAYEDLQARAAVGVSDTPALSRSAECRYAGQRFELRVSVPDPFDPATVVERFHEVHDRTHGYRMDEPVELVTLRVRATVARETPAVPFADGDEHAGEASAGDARTGTRAVLWDDSPHESSVYDRRRLPPGCTITGPAVLEDTESTAAVPPAWHATVRGDGALVLRRRAATGGARSE
jgi:N-methylhydantoinase A